MNDDAFLLSFERATLTEFHHRDHLRMVWLYLRREGPVRGEDAVREGLQRFAAAKGATSLYHDSLTRFWVRLVGHVMAALPDTNRFEDLLEHFPPVADKQLPYRHYRRETLAGANARSGWVAPDLLPLP